MMRVISSVQVTAPNGSASTAALLPGLGGGGEPQANAFPDKSGNASWAPEFVRKVRVTNNATGATPLYIRFGTSSVAASVNDAVVNINNPVLFTLPPQYAYYSLWGTAAAQTVNIEVITGDME